MLGAPNPDHSLGWRSFGRVHTPQLLLKTLDVNFTDILDECGTLDWESGSWMHQNPLQFTDMDVGVRVRHRSRNDGEEDELERRSVKKMRPTSNPTSTLSLDLVKDVLHLLVNDTVLETTLLALVPEVVSNDMKPWKFGKCIGESEIDFISITKLKQVHAYTLRFLMRCELFDSTAVVVVEDALKCISKKVESCSAVATALVDLCDECAGDGGLVGEHGASSSALCDVNKSGGSLASDPL